MADDPTAAVMEGLVRPGVLPARLRQLAQAASGDGALFIRSRGPHTLGIVASPEIEAEVAAYVRGDRPSDPRASRVNPTLDEGFRLDHDDFSDRELARDPFYQEFLKPSGFGWHATALMARLDNGDEIHLAIKRRYDRGPFAQSDIAEISKHLPLLRAAIGLTGHLLADKRVREGGVFGPGPTIVGFTSLGEAFFIHRAPEDEKVLNIRGGALVPALPHERSALAAAFAKALASATSGAVMLHGPDGRRYALRIRTWQGTSVDAIPIIGMLNALDPATEPAEEWIAAVRTLFNLSASEARVAGLVAKGVVIPEIAKALGLRSGTVRNHLKAIFIKTGATRQIDLALLLSRV